MKRVLATDPLKLSYPRIRHSEHHSFVSHGHWSTWAWSVVIGPHANNTPKSPSSLSELLLVANRVRAATLQERSSTVDWETGNAYACIIADVRAVVIRCSHRDQVFYVWSCACSRRLTEPAYDLYVGAFVLLTIVFQGRCIGDEREKCIQATTFRFSANARKTC